jgi:WD40 repeat protein
MQFTGGAWLGAPTMALVAGGVSGQVAIWSVDSHGGTSSLAKIQGHTTFITAVACSPSGLVVCYYAHMQQVPVYACAAPIDHEHLRSSRSPLTLQVHNALR